MNGGALVGPAVAPELHVMSFNIRRRMTRVSSRSPDLWSTRRPAMRRLLSTELPTILGVQEALPDQAQFVSASLGDNYRRLGRGREADRRGEGCPIFFDRRRLALDSWTQLALSETPEVPGSRSWGNFVPRMVVVARFTDRATGQKLLFLNTHFDHISRLARIRSARLVAGLVRDAGVPVVVTGDFNTSVDTLPYKELAVNGPLADTWFSAGLQLTENWGSFPNYRAPKLERKRIDWVLATHDVAVRSAAINPVRHEGIAASDHLPISALLTLPASLASSAT